MEYTDSSIKEFANIHERYYQYVDEDGALYLAVLKNSKSKNGFELVGIIGVRPCSENKKIEHKLDSYRKVCVLERMGVHENLRGMRLGTKLVEKRLEFVKVRRYEITALYVLEVNFPGIELRKVRISATWLGQNISDGRFSDDT